jgi:hypothetical protein
MSQMYQVNPVDVNRQYSYFKVFIQNVTLFTGANIMVEIYDQNKVLIESKYINLTQDEYQSWDSDDKYIVDLVAARLGYILYIPPEPPVEPPVEPTVEPTEPTVEPTEPTVEPTEPTVEPTEPPVEPTEPPVDPV